MHIKQKISRIFLNMRIKQKSFLVLTFIIITHLLFGVFINSAFIRKIITNNTVRYTCDLLLNVSSRISSQFASVVNTSQNIIYDSNIYNIVTDDEISKDSLAYYEAQKEMDSALKKLVSSNEVIGTIGIFDCNHASYFYNTDNNLSSDDKIFVEMSNQCDSAEPVWVIRDGVIYLCREIRDRNTFAAVGKIVISVKNSILEINGFEMENLYNIELISDDGIRVYSSNANEVQSAIDTAEYQRNMFGKNGYYFDYANRNLVCFAMVPDTGWSVVTHTPLKIVYGSVNTILLITLLFEFIVLLFVLFINTVFVQSMVVPIETMTDYIAAFEKNGTVDIKDNDRRDEFGFLIKCFKNMTDSISFLIEKVYKESIYRKNAQLKTLQSQVNPHFLYNTLEIINWTAQMHDIPEISDMICNLAALFGANAGKMNSMISVGQEIDYVHKYCDTVKIRYGDRLQFKYLCEDDCAQAAIPCLIIQPLVENAVMHGIGKHSQGVILIKVSKKAAADSREQRMVFLVADNGRGVDGVKLKELKLRLNDKEEDFDIGKHSGLINVQRRLCLLYGEDYGLTIRSRVETYFCVTGEIPLQMYEGDEENVSGSFD